MNVLIKKLEKQCFEMKLKALDMANGTLSHIGGGFSAMEIMATLYEVANIPSMSDPSRDRVIVSKGHCVLAYYTALWAKGHISEELLNSYEIDGTALYGHPRKDMSIGIEYSGGSLGLGLSYATGIAKACKKKGMANTIYVVMGDGEMNEGIVWEALMSIAHFSLDNIVIIIDKKGLQVDGTTNDVMDTSPLENKLDAFGFDVDEVNGHSIEELLNALPKKIGKPRAIIANTIKGHGISFLENSAQSHLCALNKRKYEQAIEDIKRAYYGEQS